MKTKLTCLFLTLAAALCAAPFLSIKKQAAQLIARTPTVTATNKVLLPTAPIAVATMPLQSDPPLPVAPAPLPSTHCQVCELYSDAIHTNKLFFWIGSDFVLPPYGYRFLPIANVDKQSDTFGVASGTNGDGTYQRTNWVWRGNFPAMIAVAPPVGAFMCGGRELARITNGVVGSSISSAPNLFFRVQVQSSGDIFVQSSTNLVNWGMFADLPPNANAVITFTNIQ